MVTGLFVVADRLGLLIDLHLHQEALDGGEPKFRFALTHEQEPQEL